MSELMSVEEVAIELDRKTSSIRRSIRQGFLKAEKVSGSWIVLRSDFEQYRDNPPKPGPKAER